VLTALLEKADSALFDWLMANPDAMPQRLRKLLATSYPDARVRKLYWSFLNVTMGEGTLANPGLLVVNTMDEEARVTIGSRVSIAPGVVLVTDSSPGNSELLMNHPEVRARMVKRAPIIIGDDAWLGAGAVILPGVTIGNGAIVGAGAVVRDDVPPMTVVAGVPARPIRTLDPA
jgi:acetyltransferase-like isoleucine patch superfamily enzyme